MKKDDKLYLIHMVESVERIRAYTVEGKNFFLSDSKTQDAVIRNFQVIGEAAKKVSENTRQHQDLQEIPWRKICGFRDILIHQYEGINMSEVWEIIEHELTSLYDTIFAYLKKEGIDLSIQHK